MKTLVVHKNSGELISVWNCITPEEHKSDYCNYVDVADDHELIQNDPELGLLPSQAAYTDWFTVMTQGALEAMTKTEIQHLADARGYSTIDKDSQTQAEMITAFLIEQSG
ncbi:hypothetical protein ACFLT7_06030 [candidate division KSB1 bacterium]